jgi:hypothetical protein
MKDDKFPNGGQARTALEEACANSDIAAVESELETNASAEIAEVEAVTPEELRKQYKGLSTGQLFDRFIYWVERRVLNSKTDRIAPSIAVDLVQGMLLERVDDDDL